MSEKIRKADVVVEMDMKGNDIKNSLTNNATWGSDDNMGRVTRQHFDNHGHLRIVQRRFSYLHRYCLVTLSLYVY